MKKTERVYFCVISLFVLLILVASFVFTVDISDVFLKYTGDNYFVSSLVYVFALIISVVVAPVTMPLFLISGGIFGPLVATVYNVLGWWIGSVIAFLLARFLERTVLYRFISLKKIDEYEKKIPEKLEFWGIVLLRMIIPVDLLSYALGFFSNISFARYATATVIGITPFAIIFAYGGSALFKGNYAIVFILVSIVVLASLIGFYIFKKR